MPGSRGNVPRERPGPPWSPVPSPCMAFTRISLWLSSTVTVRRSIGSNKKCHKCDAEQSFERRSRKTRLCNSSNRAADRSNSAGRVIPCLLTACTIVICISCARHFRDVDCAHDAKHIWHKSCVGAAACAQHRRDRAWRQRAIERACDDQSDE